MKNRTRGVLLNDFRFKRRANNGTYCRAALFYGGWELSTAEIYRGRYVPKGVGL